MKFIKKVLKTATLLGVCSILLMTKSTNSYAWDSSYSNSVYDAYTEENFWVTYTLQPRQDDVITCVSTDHDLWEEEYVHVTGWVEGLYEEDKSLADFSVPVWREFHQYLDENDLWNSTAWFYGISIDISRAKVDYALVSRGNWNWYNTYWQSITY